ncbi:SDR family oxidoreductase [Demequina litorisediminis]|uniref:Nucleoside-diphosphate sugar epimerase n=1 Tax=Demequina litorisediminis TaxID=1849022 RepID=A0ABQ6IAH2_9MICO|nr:SDR family oxidoreductase [Demequina litorisediminis]GMA34350.1 nucleoside-diphosphate sugar epimerase [Demequina litorisediminis]
MTSTLSPGATVLAIGATGSIGRLVVDDLVHRGFSVRALVRDPSRARAVLPDSVALVRGDLATGEGLADAVAGADGIVLTHGGDPHAVDYQGVARLIEALGESRPRVALMTSMSVSVGSDVYGGVLHWKRRSERLVRAAGLPHTIVRPGWFDNETTEQTGLVLEQGDTTPLNDRRGVARSDIARTLVASLTSDAATDVTLELFAASGAKPHDWEVAFAALDKDDALALAGAHDAGVALADEPAEVLADIARLRA